MKYARLIPRGDGTTQTADVLDLGAPPYDHRPLLGCTLDADLLVKLFAPELTEQWKAQNQWFTAVCGGVQASATYLGGDPMDPAQFVNPDGSDGDGVMPPPPVGPQQQPIAP